MRLHSYTELFFLDEATSLSAGHRPCAECRREDYKRFRTMWEICHGVPVSAEIIDAVLQAERGASRRKRTYRANLADLPNGAFIVLAGQAWLVWGAQLLAWSDSGYGARRRRSPLHDVEVLNPPSIIAVLSAGYRPDVHPSAL
jgi:hypothetical protein